MKQFRFLSLFLVLLFLLTGSALPAFAAPIEPDVDKLCGYVLLEDMEEDTVLYSRKSSKKLYPASTTKLVTALVVLRHAEAGDLSLSDTITCTKHVQDGMTAVAARAGLQEGEKISIRDLLYLLMLPSHCDAGNALAEAVSGSVEAFAEDMNQTAEELGCTGTHFTNPHGLHNDDHYTTCEDMYRLAKAAYQYEEYRKIIATTEYTVPATNKHDPREIHNTNALISTHTYGKTYYYKYCTGGKTGSTFQAKYCLVSYAEKKDRTLCCIMMHGDWYYNNDGSKRWMQFLESGRLFQWGFGSFKKTTLVESGETCSEISVKNARDTEPLPLIAAEEVSALVEKGLPAEDMTLSAELLPDVEAPITQGDKLGTLTVLHDDEVLGQTDLLAGRSVQALPPILGRLGNLTHEPRSNTPFIAAIGFTLGAVILLITLYRKKKS